MMTDFDLDLGLISDFKNDKMDILGTSIQESGIIFDVSICIEFTFYEKTYGSI